ncbi:MAG: hypothetical protein QGF00_13125 [Planctomycetota bacterium]|jgi:hypothetical protein|nr:hypothetical protein [Planctomycetota bacterium]MDP7250540.1 hypothetical protein [Planctomycetota bacterium]
MKLCSVLSLFSLVIGPGVWAGPKNRIPIKSVQDAVAQLKSENDTQRKRAMDWLVKNKVVETKVHPNPLLKPYLKSEKENLKNTATKAFIRWSRKADTRELIELNEREFTEKEFEFPAFKALFRVNPGAARKHFEKRMNELKGLRNRFRFSSKAIRAITALGPAAEEEAIVLLRSKYPDVVRGSIGIFSTIGTSKCIPALKAVAKRHKDLQFRIETIIKKIKARE